MLLTIQDFRTKVDSGMELLVSELQEITGRFGAEEAHAWRQSLPKLSNVFQAPSFQALHLYFGSRGNLALEYQLPASSSWCDIVLLGEHNQKASAVIIELKDWITRSDRPGAYEGLIERQGVQELHPADQVRGYTEYCRRFHSAVNDHGASVHGCVLFTRDRWVQAYHEGPNANLTREFPLFTTSPSDINGSLPQFFQHRLTAPNQNFANAFENGRYRQSRGFMAQIGTQILNPESQVFELLDNQRRAFSLCSGKLKDIFVDVTLKKSVLIVKGPPGSGKSVIAARLWASLVTDKDVPEGDVVFTTTSMSQNSNWGDLFKQASRSQAVAGVIRKATSFSPIPTQRVGSLRKKYGEDFVSDAGKWRENLAELHAIGEKWRDGAMDNQNLVTIVDEAHALINPEHNDGRGQFGFAPTTGPQAYHIIRSSLVSVFLLDPLQSFRERENTTLEDVRAWSRELGAGDPLEVSLEGSQFRCAGSAEYVEWIESLLNGAPVEQLQQLAMYWKPSLSKPRENNIVRFPPAATDRESVMLVAEESPPYRVDPELFQVPPPLGMDFRIFENPEDWEALLRTRHTEGNSVRLLSTYARKWKTEKFAKPHNVSPHTMDFHEPYCTAKGELRHWSRIWNFVPRGEDYTWFVTGHPAGRIAKDPLAEVGCPYAVRGFDYDYIGILWLDDLKRIDRKWHVFPEKVQERGILNLVSRARREANPEGPAARELLRRVVQAYRILFTRALKGVYLWVPHQETRDYIKESLEG